MDMDSALNRRQLAPEDVVGVHRLAAEGGDELSDLPAVVPGVAEDLRQDTLDVPAVAFAVGGLPLQRARQFALVELLQVGDPRLLGVGDERREFVQLRTLWEEAGRVGEVAQALQPAPPGGAEMREAVHGL